MSHPKDYIWGDSWSLSSRRPGIVNFWVQWRGFYWPAGQEGRRMLTVREALAMPVFATSHLVAGQSGLDRQINWVHIVDIPDAHYEWRRRGVLLLTAGFGLRDNPERQAELVPRLVEKGFAGMVLSTGYYFKHAPEVIMEAADRLGLPVVEAPPELLFIDVTEAILGQIVNRQYVTMQRAGLIHSQLTDLVLGGSGLEELAATLADLLQRSVTIEDPTYQVLAAGRHGSVDEARQRSEAGGHTSPDIVRRLQEAGIYQRLMDELGPVHVPPLPELGMTMERFVAPIIVDHELYGYIWIIAGDHPLTDLDELAIRHAATVAALILFKEQAVLEVEETLRGDFLEQLLRGQDTEAAFSEQTRRLNYRGDRPHQVLLVHGPPTAGGTVRSLYRELDRWLQAREAGSALVVWRDQFLVVVIEGQQEGRGKELAGAIVAAFSRPARPLLVAVGTAAGPADDQAGGVKRSYETAREAIRVGLALGRRDGVVVFSELGLLHWLYHLPADKREDNLYLQHIHTLAAYDKERKTELVKTLEAYLDHGGSLVETAQALYIHRNTIHHRLERIREVCGLDLRDPLQRLNLHAAVKSYRLNPS